MKCPANMPSHYGTGPIGIAGGEGLDEFTMFVGGAGEFGAGIAGGGAADDGLFDKRGEHGSEARGASGGDNDIVEDAVFGQEGGDIGGIGGDRGGDAIIGGAEGGECGRLDAGGGAGGGMGFEHGAQGEHFVEVVAVPIGDENALAIGANDIQFGFEPAQRFADGGARDTADIGELCLGNLCTGWGVAGQDQAADLSIGAFGSL